MAFASRTHGLSMATIAYEGAKRQAFICFVTVLHLFVLPTYLPDRLAVVPPLLPQQKWLLPHLPFSTLMLYFLKGE